MQQTIGNYRLLRQIGAGGMGTVYQAVGPDDHVVAVKLLHPQVAEDPVARDRLRREAALINKARSTGVANVLDLEVDGDQPFVVTEFIDGPTLRDDVRRNGPWNKEDLADLAQWLVRILSQLHDKGVIHRDIKPSNIMLSESGPILIDFGIAQGMGDERLTSTGLVTGTPGYVAPELIGGADPTPATDWWAWAAVLVYCATARAPFGSGNLETTLARVAMGNPDLDGVDPHIARSLRAALRSTPSKRATPLAVSDALHADSHNFDSSLLDPPQLPSTTPLTIDQSEPTQVMTPPDNEETRPLSATDPTQKLDDPTRAFAPETQDTTQAIPPVEEATRAFRNPDSDRTRIMPKEEDAYSSYSPDNETRLYPASSEYTRPPEHARPPQPYERAEPDWEKPYQPPRPIISFPLSAALCLGLAAATLTWGMGIPMIFIVVLGILGVYGGIARRLITIRMNQGYRAEGDMTRALMALPSTIVTALGAMVINGGVGWGVAWALWHGVEWAIRGVTDAWSLSQALLFPSQLGPGERTFLFVIVCVAYMVAWLLPLARSARRGYNLVIGRVTVYAWVRAIIGIVVVVVALVLLDQQGIVNEINEWISQFFIANGNSPAM